MGGSERRRRSSSWLQPRQAKFDEYEIEFESAQGAKMRVRWKAAAEPDWASLLCAWRRMIQISAAQAWCWWQSSRSMVENMHRPLLRGVMDPGAAGSPGWHRGCGVRLAS
jgi:hypothetical protein